MNVGGLQEQNGLIVVSLQDYPMLRCLERYSTNTVWMTMSAQVLKRGLFREDGSRLLSEVHIDRRRGNGRKLQQKKLKLNIGGKTAQQLS